VIRQPLRAAVLAGTLALAALVFGPSAYAIPLEETRITQPSSPTYALDDATVVSPPPAFTVEGTATTVSGNLSVRCYYGAGGGAESYATFAEVTPKEGAFKAAVEPKTLFEPNPLLGPCVMRAVPVADKAARPPTTTISEEKEPFQGPRIVGSRFRLVGEPNAPYDYGVRANTLTGFFGFSSVGECGLYHSQLFAPETLTASSFLFHCDAALYQENGYTPSASIRSELQIDGANAYSPNAAHEVEGEIGAKAPLPGAPHVIVIKTIEAGLVKVTETDPIVKCSPSSAYPPSAASCTSFVSTGVQLQREWQTSSGNQVASMTDTWSATDGVPHALNALYDEALENGGKTGGAYQFPGTNVYAATTFGQTVSLPAGLGRILYKENSEGSGEGDGEHPVGAITYDTPPSGPISIYRGSSAAEKENGFQLPYQASIPAGGSYTLHMGFIQAYKLTEVEQLASQVLSGYPPSAPPTLSITAPTSGATVTTPLVTVTGTVSDSRLVTSLSVDGQAVAVGAGGAWSTSLTLNPGANTIKALASDQAGFTAEKTASVTYIPPVKASLVGSVSGANGVVRLTIACVGLTGSSCEVETKIKTVEVTRGGRPAAVYSRRRARTRHFTVGHTKVTIPAGQQATVVIGLNSTGRRLLNHFHRLPVHLTATLLSTPSSTTVAAQNVTVTHRRRRHHR
jgi:hypothetical protein